MSGVAHDFTDAPDVETTNWNAVTLLASKYGIQLRSYAEERERLRSDEGDDASSSSSSALDLGVGTPFRITAQPIEGGRIKYQFKLREKSGMTPSSSTGSIASQASADAGPSAGRKGGLMHLATSKSIPALRNRPSNAFLRFMGGSQDSPSVQQQQQQNAQQMPGRRRGHSDASLDPAAVAGEALRNTQDSLQGGDVLSAILALDNHARPRAAAAAPRAFGRAVAVSAKAAASPETAQTATPTASSPWQRSPIPRVPDVGEPLFEDLNAFTAASSTSPHLSPPQPAFTRQLREMQSFESAASVQTARPGEEEAQQPDIGAGIFDVFQASATPAPSMSTSLSQKSFDSGLSSGSADLSASSSSSTSASSAAQSMSTSAAPGDDPRFILWAVQEEQSGSSKLVLCGHHGKQPAPSSPQVDANSKRRSAAGPSASARRRSVSQQSTLLAAATSPSKPILLAATRARLVAELTSEIDSRILSSFFYTFRCYMTTHELLSLLMLRFEWALAEPRNPQDDACRRIVRVRTYVVIKAWLTTFFELDFLADRELRNTLTTWLNALAEDERLPSRPADLSIVKSLKKTVRNLKAAYAEVGVGGLLKDDAGWRPPTAESERGAKQDVSVQESPVSTASSSSSSGAQQPATPSSPLASPMTWARRSGGGGVLAEDEHDFYDDVAGRNSPPHLPSGNSTISRAFVNTVGRLSRFRRAMGTNAFRDSLSAAAASIEGQQDHAMSASHGADTADLLCTRGGLDSYMRYCGLAPGGRSLVEEEEEEQGDEGEGTPSEGQRDTTPSLCASSGASRSTPASSIDLARQRSGDGDGPDGISGKPSSTLDEPMLGLGIQQFGDDGALVLDPQPPIIPSAHQHLGHAVSKATLRTVSSGGTEQGRQVGIDQPRKSTSSLWRATSGPNIVQIDDIDFSSDDDDDDGVVRRALRRLPGARDLRVAKHVDDLRAPPATRASFESMLSLGRVYEQRKSLAGKSTASGGGGGGGASSMRARPDSGMRSLMGAGSPAGGGGAELFDADEALAGYELVKGFRVEDFGSDDEEPGDVEEALRRLEGFIDDDKKAERARRVEALWEQSRARTKEAAAAQEGEGEGDDEQSTSSRDADNESSISAGAGTSVISGSSDGAAAPVSSPAAESISSESYFVIDKVSGEEKRDKLQPPNLVPARRQSRMRSITDGSRRPKTAIPFSAHSASPLVAFQQLRQASNPNRSQQQQQPPPLSRLGMPAPPAHRCFLLNYKSEAIAQQLCLIEAELFTSIDWTELASDAWRKRTHEGEVLDWESFYQARVRARAAGRGQTAVEAIVARFNLTCNWVASEIVLTRNLDERVALVSKLIRIAWKCYQQSNFATLVQICLALQSPWVERLRKTWGRVGMWEQRILRDLKIFTSPARDFKHLRSAMKQLVGEGDDDLSGGRGASAAPPTAGKGATRSACVPFFGIFLSDLAHNDALPTWLDPTSPNVAARSSPGARPLSQQYFAEPRAFDDLPPLPSGAHLEPLVNAYKFRNLARTIKTVLALQAKATAYDYSADAGVYVKCLKIRCLEGQQMTQ